jgi:regulation of enolase protein 1 (concanavalin A-like superfamily)
VRDALVNYATASRLVNAGTGSPNLLLFTAFQAPPTPQIEASVNPVTFSTQRVGTTSSARPVLLTNRGGAVLTIGSISLTGGAARDFAVGADGCSGRSIDAGQACTLQVVFSPTGGGTRDAALSVPSNVHDSPTLVTLTGVGVYDNGTYIPSPWTSVDIGATGMSGGAWFADNTFTVSGAGADIWGSADAFQFTSEPLAGDGTIVARVASLSGSDPWTKAGVMIRETLEPDSAHALMLVSVGKGIAYQRRTSTGGSTLNTLAATGTTPAWVKLARAGQVITASVSSDGTAWTVVGKNTFAMAGTVRVGFAVTSRSTSALATARFDRVSIAAAGASSSVLPSGWSTADVGTTGVTGSAAESGGTFTVTGAGADIWGSADAFRFAWRSLNGDGTITARVASLSGTEAWTKAGVMIRESSAAGSAHALMLISVGKGTAFQRRTATNGLTTSTAGPAGTAPRWVRLARSGQVITASVSADGATWTVVGQGTFAMASNVLVGLAASSHDPTTLATATFDAVSVTTPPASLPTGWSSRDIGSTGVTGSASAVAGTFTVRGAGADIWGSADAFRYAYRALNGDGSMTARVASLDGTQAWTKAGVMIRESLTAGSAHALMLVSAGKGTAFQRRTTTGGVSTSTTGPATAAPRWVRLSRSGQTISAFVSTDGVSWTRVGQDSFSMAATVWVGLAVSSHDSSTLATATFDQIQ